MPPQKNDFALVVGLSQYPSPEMRQLSGPPVDAKNIAAWLTRADGGGLPPENVQLILSPDGDPPTDPGDAEPTPDDIHRAFRKLRDRIKAQYRENGVKARRLYIFMAGHGFCRNDETASLLAASGDYDQNINDFIEPQTYAQWFRMECYFEEIVLWMDCCRDVHTNAMLAQAPWPASPVPDPEAAHYKSFYGFAAKSNAQSRELPLPPPSGTTQGLFTYALLQGLENAPGDANGNVSGASLAGHVFAQLKTVADKLGKAVQEPQMPVDVANDIIIVQRPVPSPVAATPANAPSAAPSTLINRYKIVFAPPAAPPDATVQVWNASGEPVGTFPTSAPLKLTALPVGLCGLRRSDGLSSGFNVMSSDETVEITLDWNGEVIYDRW